MPRKNLAAGCGCIREVMCGEHRPYGMGTARRASDWLRAVGALLAEQQETGPVAADPASTTSTPRDGAQWLLSRA